MNIITVDDHELLLLGIKSVLKNRDEFCLLEELSNAEEAWDFIKHNHNDIDVLITDICLPGMSGIELCSKTKEEYPHIIVVIYSMNETSEALHQSITAKANGFMKKDHSKSDFISNLEKILKNGTNFSPEMLYQYRVELKKQILKPQLTKREKQILELILKENTSEQIAQSLNLSKKTIDAHRANMMQKFDVKSSIGLIKIALESKFP